MASPRRTVDAMVLKIQELEGRALNATIYDTRPHEDSVVTSFIDPSKTTSDGEWAEQAEEIDETHAVQYIDHEWRDVMALYSDDGFIKTGPQIDPVYAYLLVDDPNALDLRIERLSGGYRVSVSTPQSSLYEHVFSDDTL